MRIGMLLPNHHFPPDIRVEKEAQVLSAAGHEVFLLSRRDGSQPPEEQVGPIHVVRHRVHPGSALRRKADSLTFLVTMDSPSWRAGMESLIIQHGCEVLHLHDLPYVPSAVKAARRHGVPVVLDLHENYPAALALWGRQRRKLLFSPARAARLERWALRSVDRVIVVVDEAKDRVTALGADPDRVTVFGNTEPLGLVPPAPLPLDFSHGLRLVYVGGIAAHRGLDTAIQAMTTVCEHDPAAMLTIVGDGDALPTLRALTDELGLADHVRFTGWLGKDEAMTYIADANVALVPHHRSPHTDATIPHKLFQYMALGRPVIVSDCAPLARIVRQEGCGLVFRSGDAVDLASQVLKVADPATAGEMAAAGRAAVLERWNLEAEGVALTEMYAGLARHR
ncbi:MAG: glycosyltransferase family 4 protein [Coriobacteriales bacterium]|nr:glycosyltransferase family 4 protein [Actinomycetes bacterium]